MVTFFEVFFFVDVVTVTFTTHFPFFRVRTEAPDARQIFEYFAPTDIEIFAFFGTEILANRVSETAEIDFFTLEFNVCAVGTIGAVWITGAVVTVGTVVATAVS